MTHRTIPAVSFSSVRRRELVAEFTAGHITSDAGLLLLREADRQIGLTAALDAAIADPRSPERIVHPQRTLLAQRVLGLAAGYEDLNDHGLLRRDPLWRFWVQPALSRAARTRLAFDEGQRLMPPGARIC